MWHMKATVFKRAVVPLANIFGHVGDLLLLVVKYIWLLVQKKSHRCYMIVFLGAFKGHDGVILIEALAGAD